MDFTRFPLKEMLERGCFGDFEGNAQRLKEYAEDLIRKFMQDLLPKQVSPAFLRAPMHQRGDRQADEGDSLREPVISRGRTGYIALYDFYPEQDQVLILTIRHQREVSLRKDSPRANSA